MRICGADYVGCGLAACARVVMITVAATAFILPRAALAGPAPCTIAGMIATCSGDQSDGISSVGDFDPHVIRSLLVTGLATDIAPNAGTPGLFHSGLGDIAIRYDAGPFAIATSGGADGIVGMLQTGTVYTQDQTVSQQTINQQTSATAHATGTGGEDTDAHVNEQIQENAQLGLSGGTLPGKLAISSAGDIDAAGDGIVATAETLVELSQTQAVSQTNTSDQTGATATADGAGTQAAAIQTNTQSNTNAQTATISGVTANAIEIDNSGTVVAGGDGIVAISEITVRISQGQTVTQENSNAQNAVTATAKDGGTATARQTSEQSNLNTQSAAISDVDFGGIAINNSGAIFAAGNGIVAESRSVADLVQNQDVTQVNYSAQDDNAATANGATSEAVAAQESPLLNANIQTATVEAGPGTIRIKNSGTIVAGGDGIVATSAAGASATQDQLVDQSNESHQSNSTTNDIDGGSSAAPQGTDLANDVTQNASASGLSGDIFITNSGSITAGGAGISADFLTSLVNSGSIVANIGVSAEVLTSFVNSGLVIGTGGTAIEAWGGADSRLTLLPGSNIQGLVDLGWGVNTLVTGTGLSMSTSFASVPDVIDTNGAPFVVSGTTVHVADPTGIALAADMLSDTTSAISGVLAGKFGGAANGAVAVATGNGTEITITPVADTGVASRAWAEVFGGWRDRAGDAPMAGSIHLFGGAIAGIDVTTGDATRLGAFVGGSASEADVDHDTQDIDAETVFAGIYASGHAGAMRIDTGVTVGLADYDSRRRVANNMVVGGIETATADYGATFVSPELTVSTSAAMGTATVRPSLRVRYAGLWLDGYSESGSASSLTVDDRDVHFLEARAQLAVPMSVTSDEHGLATMELRLGVDGRTRLGSGEVDAVLVGQGLSFDPGGDDEVLAGFVAAAFAMALHNGVTITGSVEGGYGTDEAAHASGRLGARLDF